MSDRRDVLRRLRGSALRRLAPLITWFLSAITWSQAQAIGRTIGSLAFRVGGRDRRRSLAHLHLAFPDLDPAEHRRIAHASFRCHGMNLAEVLHLMRRDLQEAIAHLEIEGWEHVQAAGQRPLLLVTGHCGNWELFSPAFQSRGRSLAAVVRRMDEDWAEELATRVRQRFGTTVIRRGSRRSVPLLRKVMEGREALIMLIDQDIRVESVWVPFFGHLARTPSGPAALALRRRMVVLPAFCIRRKDGSHLVRFQPALDLPDDLTGATAAMTGAVEEHVRGHPEQWVWMHRRWRHPPPMEGSPSSASGRRPERAGMIASGDAPGDG